MKISGHLIVWIIGVIFLLILICYTYVNEHRVDLNKDHWRGLFKYHESIVDDISHDEYMWYYKGKSTCVGFGEPDTECSRSQSTCAGASVYGDFSTQAREVERAITNDGIHPDCPTLK